MGEIKDGGPAFPESYIGDDIPNIGIGGGMSLRDWFAGMALQGLLACEESGVGIERFAEASYKFADAMLAEREKEKK